MAEHPATVFAARTPTLAARGLWNIRFQCDDRDFIRLRRAADPERFAMVGLDFRAGSGRKFELLVPRPVETGVIAYGCIDNGNGTALLRCNKKSYEMPSANGMALSLIHISEPTRRT